MKKNLMKCLLALVLVFASVVSAFAAYTENDIKQKIRGLNSVYAFDCSSLINKNEVIGYRLSDFNSQTAQYKSGIQTNIQRMNNNSTQLALIRSSNELSDSEKELNANKIFQDIDAALYDVDSKTINYLVGLRSCLSTITYTRFVKKYQMFYNALRISNGTIHVQ